MSEVQDKLREDLEKFKQAENEKIDVQVKEAALKKHKVDSAYDRMQQANKELEIAQRTNFGELSPECIANLQRQSTEYIEAAKEGMHFIIEDFKGVVPFFRKNLILIGAKTGEGKSTAVANIAFNTICQKNPHTREWRRVLVITNEEKTEDVYNRVTCLIKGWHYANHDKLTEEQKKTMEDYIPRLAKNGRLTVIDNDYNGAHGLTTTYEGIKSIFEGLIRDKIWYDCIIIDYYQNVKESKNNPFSKDWEVQGWLANLLDQYKNVYPAPIVVMAQVQPPEKKNTTPFEHRIKGRKVIIDKSTVAIEMIANRESLTTEWVVHKSRFTEALGKSRTTGYDRGKFVKNDSNFQAKINKMREDRQMARISGKEPESGTKT